MTTTYSLEEIREALARVCPSDAARVLHELEIARVDAKQKDALARMKAAAEAMKAATGFEWLELQSLFDRAWADSDAAQAEADRLYAQRRRSA